MTTGIMIFRGARNRPASVTGFRPEETTAFVTIGAGETHVSVLSSVAECLDEWVAVFGWSTFSRMVPEGSRPMKAIVEDGGGLHRAGPGQAGDCGTGIRADIRLPEAEENLRRVMEDILDRTIGEDQGISAIRFCAPAWMHDTLARSIAGLRPNICLDILDSD